MIEHIVGRRSRGFSDVARTGAQRGAPLLELTGAERAAQARQCRPDGSSRARWSAWPACSGSGRSALARVLVRRRPDDVRRDPRSRASRSRSTAREDAIAHGIALVPEDRAAAGPRARAHRSKSTSSLSILDRHQQLAVRLASARRVELAGSPDQGAADQDRLARCGRAHALGRQSAEGRDRQMAERPSRTCSSSTSRPPASTSARRPRSSRWSATSRKSRQGHHRHLVGACRNC